MSKVTVFMDVDGVLADFVGPALKAFDKADLITTYPKGMYDMPGILGIKEDEFWTKIDTEEFWKSLPVIPKSKEFVRDIYRLGVDVVFATIPARSSAGAAAKIDWLVKNFKVSRNYAITPMKLMFAAPKRILIDDSDANIAEWKANGGDTVLVPQLWNKEHALAGAKSFEIALLRLKAILNSYNKEVKNAIKR